jgi:hypothetical protein
MIGSMLRSRPGLGLALVALVLGVAVIGCTTASGPDSEAPGSQSPSDGATPSPSAAAPTSSGPSPAPSTDVPAAIIDSILADASGRTGVPVEELVIREARLGTWPDGGLGCPEPGMVYIQVLVDGYQVVVVAEPSDGLAVELDYRGGGGSFRLCPFGSG